MKTIDVNLIGDLGKTSKINVKNARKKSSLSAKGAKNQIFAWITLISILMVFAGSIGGWLLVRKMSHHLDRNLVKLNQSIDMLKQQESDLSNFRENLRKEKEATEYKILIQKQLNSSFFPWSSVLREIAVKIPKNMIILKIEKTGETGVLDENGNSLKLKISGVTSPNQNIYPLTAISLFIFNLNNNKNSLLTDAKISKLEFNDKTKAYEYEIEVSVQQDKKL